MGIFFDSLIKKIDAIDHPDQLNYEVVDTLMHNALITMIEYYHNKEGCEKKAFDKVYPDIIDRFEKLKAIILG